MALRPPEARTSLRLLVATLLVALGATAGFVGTAHAASKLQVLHSFQNLGGNVPEGGLIADGAGNLYGTTSHGGAHDDGIVFELSPPSEGKKNWSETVLHSFDGSDGKYPLASLVADGAGNLYGTTSQGGPYKQGGVSGGVAFELTPPPAGKNAWIEKVLYFFGRLDGKGRSDGKNPYGSLIADGAGNLYGTTLEGGRGGRVGDGAVFELTPPGDGRGRWTKTVLYSFTGASGESPNGALLADGAGNLYGTTVYGGASGVGAVFELSPPAKGLTAWNEAVLYSFSNADSGGAFPYAGLIADGAGNLYGAAYSGGASGYGAVFELSPPAKGLTTWNETVLYSFSSDESDGSYPYAGLVADGAGNLYGTTLGGGTYDYGVVFKLSPPPEGQTAWTETVLHAFSDGNDGGSPHAGLLADGAGNFYGTTAGGGKHEDGIVFKITP
jgi:uncharacterized repeat protein (TIGR03803 family)